MPTPGKVQYIYPTNLENQPDAENPEIFKNNSPNYGHLPPQGLFDKYKRKILEIKPTEKPQKVRFRNFSKNEKTNFESNANILSYKKVIQKLEGRMLSDQEVQSANEKAKLTPEELDFVLKVCFRA